jgi:ABC-type multidrug transport system ATPase subunit
MSLVIENLTKQYNKHKTGLSDYSITIEKKGYWAYLAQTGRENQP